MDELLTPISKVFAHKLLRIPDYQRGYAWGVRQWDDFLNDLEYLPKEKMHFTGTVVLHARDDLGPEDLMTLQQSLDIELQISCPLSTSLPLSSDLDKQTVYRNLDVDNEILLDESLVSDSIR